jgi:hypothetical protein
VFFKEAKEEFGVDKVATPERYVLFIDHMIPAAAPKEEELHQNTRAWGAKNNVPVHERKGIGHQVSAELGYATPGAFIVHFDGHVSQLGAFGTYAFGARKGVLEAFNARIRRFDYRPGTPRNLGPVFEVISGRQVDLHIEDPCALPAHRSANGWKLFCRC